MKIQAISQSISNMPRSAYILLYSVLALCCLMLVAALAVYFRIDECGIHNFRELKLAILLTESPAGVLLTGGILVCYLIERGK